METKTSISEIEVRLLAECWFSNLDIHAPYEDYLHLFAFEDEEFVMQFPNVSVHNLEQFEQWYEGAIHLFFDETHFVKELTVKVLSEDVEVTAIIHWEASMWQPPTANSSRIVMDAHHTWIVSPAENSAKAKFKKYIVHRFDFAEGSAKPQPPKVDTGKG